MPVDEDLLEVANAEAFMHNLLMARDEVQARRARHRIDDNLPSTTLYSRKNPSLVKYVRLYEDTVSDEEGSTSEEEVEDSKRSHDGGKKKKKNKKGNADS